MGKFNPVRRLIVPCLAVSLFSFFFVSSCRKNDRNSLAENGTTVYERFFRGANTVDATTTAISDKLKRQEKESPFIATLSQQAGFPRWNATKFSASTSYTSRETADERISNFTLIPFVRSNENFVNSLLIVRISGSDTSYKILYANQYADFGFDTATGKMSARDIFGLFTDFDRTIFGTSVYVVQDGRIMGFKDTTQLHTTITPTTSESGRSITTCHTVTGCVYVGAVENARLHPSMPAPCVTTTYCTTYYFDDYIDNGGSSGGGGGGDSGGGSGGGSGGSGGGSGGGGDGSGTGGSDGPDTTPGGYTPPTGVFNPPCRTLPLVGTNCTGNGPWFPVVDDEIQDPTDSLLAVALRATYLKCKDKADSAHAEANRLNREHTFTFVRAGADTVGMWPLMGQENFSFPTLGPGFFGVCHTHQDEGSTDPYKNQSYDGPDIYKLYYHNNRGENLNFLMITTRDYIYAAVVTDRAKFISYIQSITGSSKISTIAQMLNSLHVDKMDGTPGSWQYKSEMGTLAITGNGNSSISGIKVFRSPRENVSFSILTP